MGLSVLVGYPPGVQGLSFGVFKLYVRIVGQAVFLGCGAVIFLRNEDHIFLIGVVRKNNRQISRHQRNENDPRFLYHKTSISLESWERLSRLFQLWGTDCPCVSKTGRPAKFVYR